MTIDMNDDHIISVSQLKEIVKMGSSVKFNSNNKEETYRWINNVLGRFRYFRETKKNRGIIKEYTVIMTGYSPDQINKLISRKRKTGRVFLKERTQHVFPTKYEASDIALLADTSNVNENPNGKSLKKIIDDMYHLYKDNRFERLIQISVSHLYNLRKTNIFTSRTLLYTKTNPVKSNIGERRKPQSEGKPGYLRVDSVHQGDLEREKGVYHINLVDEVTQFQYIGCVEGISEHFLTPLLEDLIKRFPFKIFGFHSDNGSEYINKNVAFMLKKMCIEQTKSRARKSNDNALVEGKNNATIRKHMGYIHIPKKHAKDINIYYQDLRNDHLNFHRPCMFATDYTNAKGKIVKKYDTCMTPVQKLLSIPNIEEYLIEEITREMLFEKQMEMSHLESAQRLREAKHKLFKSI